MAKGKPIKVKAMLFQAIFIPSKEFLHAVLCLDIARPVVSFLLHISVIHTRPTLCHNGKSSKPMPWLQRSNTFIVPGVIRGKINHSPVSPSESCMLRISPENFARLTALPLKSRRYSSSVNDNQSARRMASSSSDG